MRLTHLFFVAGLAVATVTAASSTDRQLVSTLTSPTASQKDKADACRELAVKGSKDAVEALARLLVNPELSHMARYALETIPGPAVDKALLDALGKTDGRVLSGIIGSIGVRGDAKAVPTLSSFLHYRDALVAQASARALGSIGTPGAVKALQTAYASAKPEDKLAIAEGLLRAAERSIEQKKIDQAMTIFDGIARGDAPHQLRTAALRGSAMTRGEGARSLLLQALRGNDYAQAAAAARIAQYLTPLEISLALSMELPKLPADRQILVLHALAKRGEKSSIPAITSLISTSNEQRVRLAAIRVLPQFQQASVNPLLVDLLGNADAEIARAAQESLASLPGAEVDKAVMNLISSTTSARRINGFDLAARRRMTSAVPFLMKAAADTDVKVRTAAVRRLGELASTQDTATMLDMLSAAKSTEDSEAIENALGSILAGSTNHVHALDALSGRFQASAPMQKVALLRLMTSIGGDKALQTVSAAMQDSAPPVRAAAIRSLGAWNTPAAAPQLLELARNPANPTERLLALRGYLGLARLAEVPEARRLEMIGEAATFANQPEDKKLLLAGLGDIASTNSVAMILPHLEDSSVKEEAATALANVAERLLARQDAAASAEALVGPLERVAAITTNEELAKRARKLAELAKSKAQQGK